MNNSDTTAADRNFQKNAMASFVQIAALVILAVWCLRIVAPFVSIILWGISRPVCFDNLVGHNHCRRVVPVTCITRCQNRRKRETVGDSVCFVGANDFACACIRTHRVICCEPERRWEPTE